MLDSNQINNQAATNTQYNAGVECGRCRKKISRGTAMVQHELERERGWVKWYNDERGCGFVCRPDNQGDAFITRANFRGDQWLALADGQSVEYRPTAGNFGIEGHDVTVLAE
jgi:CspA family cold shock protein